MLYYWIIFKAIYTTFLYFYVHRFGNNFEKFVSLRKIPELKSLNIPGYFTQSTMKRKFLLNLSKCSEVSISVLKFLSCLSRFLLDSWNLLNFLNFLQCLNCMRFLLTFLKRRSFYKSFMFLRSLLDYFRDFIKFFAVFVNFSETSEVSIKFPKTSKLFMTLLEFFID